MSASAKTSSLKSHSINSDVKKLGILAGGGVLPRLLINNCHKNKIVPYVVGFGQQTDRETYDLAEHINTRFGASGRTIGWLKEHNVKDIVFIGSVQRPSIWEILPDFQTLCFLIRCGVKFRGDNAMLGVIREELERIGFNFYGVHKFLPELLSPKGVMSKIGTKDFTKDIALGVSESQKLGRDDIGQAVIIKNGTVIEREDKKGTNALIANYGQEGAVLVKTCKPQQDKDLDLPTIGLSTVQACIDKKMAGITVHAENSLFLDRQESIILADKNNFFITGICI